MSGRFTILRWLPGAILLTPCGVEGAIVKVVPDEPFFLTDTRFTGPIDWDVDLDGNADYRFENNGITQSIVALEFNRFTGSGSSSAALDPGSEIGSLLENADWRGGSEGLYACASFGNHNACIGNFADGGILGIEFRIDSDIHYGWMFFESFTPFLGGQLVEWAYESEPDTPILAGIPEPPVALLGGLVVLGAMFRRSRRSVSPAPRRSIRRGNGPEENADGPATLS